MSKASLDGLNLTVFDEIYVQTQNRVPFDTEAPPLAFAEHPPGHFAGPSATSPYAAASSSYASPRSQTMSSWNCHHPAALRVHPLTRA